MKLIETEFKFDIYKYENAAGDTYSETCDVDKCVNFLPFHVAQSRLKIIFNHNNVPFNGFFDKPEQRPNELTPEPDPGGPPSFGKKEFSIYGIHVLREILTLLQIHESQEEIQNPSRSVDLIIHRSECSGIKKR